MNTHTYAQKHWLHQPKASLQFHILTPRFLLWLSHHLSPTHYCPLIASFLHTFTQTHKHIVTCSIHQSLLWLKVQFLLCSPLISRKKLPLILQNFRFIYFSLVTVCIRVYILCCLEVVGDSGKGWSRGDYSSNFTVTQLASSLYVREINLNTNIFLSVLMIAVVKKNFVSSQPSLLLFVVLMKLFPAPMN